MEQPLSAPLNGIAIEFGYYPKPCDIATGRFSVQTLPDHENSVATVVGDPNAFKDWIYPGAQQQRQARSISSSGWLAPRKNVKLLAHQSSA